MIVDLNWLDNLCQNTLITICGFVKSNLSNNNFKINPNFHNHELVSPNLITTHNHIYILINTQVTVNMTIILIPTLTIDIEYLIFPILSIAFYIHPFKLFHVRHHALADQIGQPNATSTLVHLSY